jgi:acetyl-CoA synthetase
MTTTRLTPRKVHPGQTFNMAAFAMSRAALVTPDKPALIVVSNIAADRPAEVWTYGRLERAILSVAALLRDRDYERGSRIAIRLDNTSAYPIVFFGAIAAGYVPVAMSAALTPREALFLVRDSGASCVVLAENLPLDGLPDGVDVVRGRDLEAWISRAPSSTYAFTLARDPAFMIYTSGTSAEPKGVVHAHRSILGRVPMVDGWYGMTRDDRVLHAGAFNWTLARRPSFIPAQKIQRSGPRSLPKPGRPCLRLCRRCSARSSSTARRRRPTWVCCGMG